MERQVEMKKTRKKGKTSGNKHLSGRTVRRKSSVQTKMPNDATLRRAADLMRILGDKARLKLVFSLAFGRKCVNDLSQLIGLSQSATSHQLRLLRTARIVSPEKEGKHVYYLLTDDVVRKLVGQTVSLMK
jgi:ArsR family transcriptional regulator